MKHTEGTFKGMAGVDLFYQTWLPEGAPRAALAIVHGMGDHSGRFDRLVLPLAERGFASFGFDLRGYGRSPGIRGYINSFKEYREDLRAFLNFISGELPGTPRFVLGYSLGSSIVLDYIIRDPGGLHGAILSGVAIEPAGAATPGRVFLARIFSRIWPTLSIDMGDDMTKVTHDVTVQEAFKKDPYHVRFATARWGAEVLDAVDWVRSRAEEINLPVLFVHGGDDPINLLRGAQKYFDQIKYADKTLKVYPGSLHETHNDRNHARVAEDIAAWMGEHIPH